MCYPVAYILLSRCRVLKDVLIRAPSMMNIQRRSGYIVKRESMSNSPWQQNDPYDEDAS